MIIERWITLLCEEILKSSVSNIRLRKVHLILMQPIRGQLSLIPWHLNFSYQNQDAAGY